ncbi:MAG: Uma2 family endonuclease [Timaviella obliquedivisa GSE-PSE-MK23-08B]|jgi:Uma2 family endonuclease|nr:Uma2 family endonuclease [Timaviella obliquedivisa GSE-PSE-MK23-08B]
MVTLQLRQIDVPPGHRVLFKDVSWQEFEEILEELGDRRASRLAYSKGMLEIRMPLPKHEKAKAIIGDLVKILLEETETDCENFASSTFKRKDIAQGIEPDDCFYIQNYAQMIGKDRVDLSLDPPPDLAIEVDVTSRTQLDAYQTLGVPELWRYEEGNLRIDVLADGKYVESQVSPTFPNFPVPVIVQFVEQSLSAGRSATLRAFRQWVREHLNGL